MRVDRVAREHDAGETHVDLSVREELLAPRVEQCSVGGAGDLHALGNEPGQPELGRRRRLRVVIAPSRVRAYEILGDRERSRDGGAHGVASNVATGVNDTSDVHNGSSGVIGGGYDCFDVDIAAPTLFVLGGDPARRA